MENENFRRSCYEKRISALLLIAEDERKMADFYMARALEANSLLAELLEFIEEHSGISTSDKNWPMLRQKVLLFVLRKDFLPTKP